MSDLPPSAIPDPAHEEIQWKKDLTGIGALSALLGMDMAAREARVPKRFRPRFARAYNHVLSASKELTSIMSEMTDMPVPPHPEPLKEDY